MGLASRLSTAALKLPRGIHRVRLTRNLRVPMPDGVTLLTDHYAPASVDRAPTILIRSPYGRSGPIGVAFGDFYAQHGFQVLIQSCRGTFGSGGTFEALDEHDDGLATVDWMKQEPWFGGTFAMHGPSYLGYTQWAIAADAGPELKALSAQISASYLGDAANVGGSFALESTLIWSTLTAGIEKRFTGHSAVLTAPFKARRAALTGRPLAELDAVASGVSVPFYQDLLVNNWPGSSYWKKRDFRHTVGDVGAAVSLLGGWYDIFLPWQLKDYVAMRASGRQPHLTVGPWFHTDGRHFRASAIESLAWFRAHLLGDPSGIREKPVRIFVTGAKEWREYGDWPVPGSTEQRWHLQTGRGLGVEAPLESTPDAYRYDPAHPTPALSGPIIVGLVRPVDNRRLETRRDVLTFTSGVLSTDLEVIGPVTAELYIRSSREHTDFGVRLCDVSPDGASYNLIEGIRRLVPGEPRADADGIREVTVELWPIAHRFARGHRLRVQVVSGAYPRVARNLGDGEPLGTGTAMHVAQQEIFHDPDHPSAIILPVVNPE